MRLWALVGVTLGPAICHAAVTYPQREIVPLAGEWQYTPLKASGPDEAGTVSPKPGDARLVADLSDEHHPLQHLLLEPTGPAEPVSVPQPGNESRPPFGLLERTIAVPGLAAGRRAVLRFAGVGFACEVSVNGHRVGAHWGPFNEFECDVTDLLPDAGTVAVRVVYASESIALRPRTPEEVYSGGPPLDVPVLLHPRGKTRDIRGIWREVFLELRPAVQLAELSVQTRLVGPRLTVAGSIAGETGDLRVAATIGDDAGATWDLGSVAVTDGRFTIGGRCPGAALWTPTTPRLYSATVSLLRDGRLVDSAVVPVGFRELRVRNADIRLNGQPVRLYGTSLTDPFLTEAQIRRRLSWFRSLNMSAVRFHGQPHPEYYLDAADELGLLVVDESDLFGTCDAANYPYGDAVFDRAVEASFREWITQHRLHPSVAVWSLENEVAAAWPYAERGPLTRWLASLSHVVRRYDPTRPIEYESDGDPLAAADIVCAHYPGEGYCATGVHGQLRLAREDKPFMVGEFSCIDDSKGAAARWVGDAAYYEPSAQAEGVLLYLRATIEGWRRSRFDGILPFQWNYAEPRWAPPAVSGAPAAEAPLATELRRLFAPIAIGLTDDKPTSAFGDAGPVVAAVTDGRAYVSGETIRKTVHIQSDMLKPLHADVRWSLVASDGGPAVVSGAVPITCPADGNAQASLAIPTPEVRSTTDYKLVVGMPGVPERRAPITIYPAAMMSPPQLREPVGLYDASGETLTVLNAAGIPARAINDFAQPLPRLTIIGRESVDESVRAAAPALRRHVAEGGTLVIFEQRDLSGLELPVELAPVGEQRAYITPHAPGHPLFTGLTGTTVGSWRAYPAGLRSSYSKPASGRFRMLAGASGERWVGNSTLAIAEVPYGNGRYVLCQVELIGHYGRDPQATVLTHNLLRWADAAQPSPEPATCAVVHGEAPAFAEAYVRGTGRQPSSAGLEGLSPERGDVAVILAGHGVDGLQAQSSPLAAFAQAGGTVLCLGASAANWDPAWLPTSASIAEPSESRYVLPVRQDLQSDGAVADPLLWGLPASDLSAGDIWDDVRRVRDPFTSWDPSWQVLAWSGPAWTGDRWKDFAARPDMRRAAILQRPHGKGRYLLVQAAVLPETSPFSAASSAARTRVFATFLTNLNLSTDPPGSDD